MHGFKLTDKMSAMVDRSRKPLPQGVLFDGDAVVENWGKDGKLKWTEKVVLSLHKDGNGIVNEGLNHILDVGWGAVAKVATWYLSLVDVASFSAFDASDVMSSHAGWIENEDYDEATRVEWDEDAAASQSITNSTTSDFSMNATVSIKGLFIVSVNTKGGTTGVLWATGAFTGGDQDVDSGDTLKVTYTINASAV